MSNDNKFSYTKLETQDLENNDAPVILPDYPVKPSASTRRGRPLWRWILKIILVISLLVLMVASLLGLHFYRVVSREVKEWTVEDPGDTLPVVKVPQSELDLFKESAQSFVEALQKGQVPDHDFQVSTRIMNGFAAHSDYLRGNVFSTMEEQPGTELSVQVRLPAKFLPGGHGRYLVGTETFTWIPDKHYLHLKMVDVKGRTVYDVEFNFYPHDEEGHYGQWWLEITAGQILGRVIPQECIEEHYNLLGDFYHCDHHDKDCHAARRVLDGLDSVAFQDDAIVFHPRKKDYYRGRQLQEQEESEGPYKGLRALKWKAGRHLLAL